MTKFCSKCGFENKDNAQFCKKCGNQFKQIKEPETIVNPINNKKSSNNNNTKLIAVALIIIVIALAGIFVYSSGILNSNEPVTVNNTTEDQSVESNSTQAVLTDDDSMSILGGSFSTGGGLSDKTYASINVGPEHAGEKVKIQIFYSRDGSDLNDGNIVPKTVSSDGYIEVASAEPYKYYPDHAEINLYDNSGKLLDTQSVSLSTTSGTQTFD